MSRAPQFTPQQYKQKPRDYDPRLCDEIIDRVSNGEDLVSICNNDPDMPLPGTFMRWVNRDPILASELAEALRIRTELMVEMMPEVATHSFTGGAELKALQWHAERLLPEKYGQRSYLSAKVDADQPKGGVDPTAELRRRVEAIARRRLEAQERGLLAAPVGSKAAD